MRRMMMPHSTPYEEDAGQCPVCRTGQLLFPMVAETGESWAKDGLIYCDTCTYERNDTC